MAGFNPDLCFSLLQAYGAVIFAGVAVAMVLLLLAKNGSGNCQSWVRLPIAFLLPFTFAVWLLSSQINPRYLGYGYALNGFSEISREGNVLWLADPMLVTGSLTVAKVRLRIQAIELNTGKKLFTKLLGPGAVIVGHGNGLVWLSDKKVVYGYDATSGLLKFSVDQKFLMANFPALAAGVHKIGFNQKAGQIEILTNTGMPFRIDLEGKKLLACAVLSPPALPHFSFDEGSVYQNRSANVANYRRLFGIDRSSPKEVLRSGDEFYTGKQAQSPKAGFTFFNGRFLGVDAQHAMVLLASSPTMLDKTLVLSGLSLKGELLWQRNGNELGIGDLFDQEPKYKVSFFRKHQVLIVFDGFVIALAPTTGKLQWCARL